MKNPAVNSDTPSPSDGQESFLRTKEASLADLPNEFGYWYDLRVRFDTEIKELKKFHGTEAVS